MKCVDCPTRARPGKTRCGKCLALARDRIRDRRAKHRAQGLCMYCTRPRLAELVYCEICRARANARKRTPRAIAKQCEYNRRHRHKKIIERVYGSDKSSVSY